MNSTIFSKLSGYAFLFGLTTSLTGPALNAGEVPPSIPSKNPIEEATVEKEKNWLDQIFGIGKIYSNKENPYLQEVRLLARFQYQYATTDSNTGHWDQGEIRRWRLGARIKFLEDFTATGIVNVNHAKSRLYQDLFEASLKWELDKAFYVQVGKKRLPWSLENRTSSNDILTPERSLLVNQLRTKEPTGIQVGGAYNGFDYTLGVYAADQHREFAHFDEGLVLFTSLGYDFGKLAGADKFRVGFDYLHHTDDPADNNFRTRNASHYENIFNVNVEYVKDRFYFGADVFAATGDENQAVWGFTLLPAYYIIPEKLQVVGKYHYASSDDSNGIRLSSRYERQSSVEPESTLTPPQDQYGDQYHSVYLGLNYYIHGKNLKLQSGVEWFSLQDQASVVENNRDASGWTWTTGIRVDF